MNQFATAKALTYLALIFAAGGATGAVVTLRNARAHAAQPVSMTKVCTRLQDRLKCRLGLSPEQMRKLQPIFDQTARDLQAVRSNAICETDQIICRAHHQIAPELTPEQNLKLKEFDRERHDWLQQRLNERSTTP